jgi:hypothetical protein
MVYPKMYPVNIINTTCKPAKTIPPTQQYNHKKCTQREREREREREFEEFAKLDNRDKIESTHHNSEN